MFTHVVREGDTLWDISQTYDIPIAFIALQSGIVDVENIMPGDILYIPESSVTPPTIEEQGKKIVVVLLTQRLYVYEEGIPIKEYVVSTGLPDTPTVQGSYSIYKKYDSIGMSGPGYNLPDVPWTMFFFEGYAIHGTYWHDNFGSPMSHGCVNMKTDEAEWLYNWAETGTPVVIFP